MMKAIVLLLKFPIVSGFQSLLHDSAVRGRILRDASVNLPLRPSAYGPNTGRFCTRFRAKPGKDFEENSDALMWALYGSDDDKDDAANETQVTMPLILTKCLRTRRTEDEEIKSLRENNVELDKKRALLEWQMRCSDMAERAFMSYVRDGTDIDEIVYSSFPKKDGQPDKCHDMVQVEEIATNSTDIRFDTFQICFWDYGFSIMSLDSHEDKIKLSLSILPLNKQSDGVEELIAKMRPRDKLEHEMSSPLGNRKMISEVKTTLSARALKTKQDESMRDLTEEIRNCDRVKRGTIGSQVPL